MTLRQFVSLALVVSLFVLVASVPSQANAVGTNGVSITLTKTKTLSATSTGSLQVSFNMVSLAQTPPQAYSFGIMAQTAPGSSITLISWQFGDGAIMNVPYCCQSQVSEVQYHAYAQPGMYTVTVVVFDNAGNSGLAQVNVNWITPVPEYSNYSIVLLLSMLLVPILLRRKRTV